MMEKLFSFSDLATVLGNCLAFTEGKGFRFSNPLLCLDVNILARGKLVVQQGCQRRFLFCKIQIIAGHPLLSGI